MQRKTLIPLTLLAAIVAVGWFAAPTVQAHDGVASGTCQGGVQWSYTNFEKADANSITVTIDGTVRYQDLDFKASDTGQILTDKTVAHTWDVKVDAPGTQFDKHPSGSYPACVTAPTTTVAATTTTIAVTTTVPATTLPADTTVAPTTTVVAVDIPPVPCPYNPTVPADSPDCTAPTTTVAASDVVSVEPALPRTGAGETVGFIGLALLMVAVGGYLAIKGRRVR